MAGVVFVFVREDASEAEIFAEAFDEAGFSISGSQRPEDAVSVVIWSRHAMRSRAFREAAEIALRSGRAVLASLIAPPPSARVFEAPVVDLSRWDGADDVQLDALLDAADALVRPPRASVIEMPPRPDFEDAEFTELPLLVTSETADRSQRARRAWETPIPNHSLRPVQESPASSPPPEKLGAPAPRRDFRRVGARQRNPVHAALAFVMVALIGGGVFAAVLSSEPAERIDARAAPHIETGGVSLDLATAEAIGAEDVAPIETPGLFEPPVQVGRRGLEPPSARTVRRAAYAPGER